MKVTRHKKVSEISIRVTDGEALLLWNLVREGRRTDLLKTADGEAIAKTAFSFMSALEKTGPMSPMI